MNIPNLLTVIRLMLVPVVGFLMGYDQMIPAVIIYIVACTTDVIDGRVARRFNAVTDFGKLMDPAADKLLTLVVVIMLAVKNIIYPGVFILNWIVPIILCVKEVLQIIGGLVLLRNKSIVRSSNWYGKLSTVLFFAAFVLLMAFNEYAFNVPFVLWAGRILLLLAVLFAFFAFFMYVGVYVKLAKSEQ